MGDIATISVFTAICGGFLSGAALVTYLQGLNDFLTEPLRSFGALVVSGFLGAIGGLFVAFPLGLVTGSLVSRFIGGRAPHAAFSGFLTATAIFVMVTWGLPFDDLGIVIFGCLFASFGAAMAALSHYLFMVRVANFSRER